MCVNSRRCVRIPNKGFEEIFRHSNLLIYENIMNFNVKEKWYLSYEIILL